MSKKTFIPITYHVSQYIDASTKAESDVLIIASGHFVDPVPKVKRPTARFEGKGRVQARAKTVYVYMVNRANGYTHRLPDMVKFESLIEGLKEAGYVQCTKDEYDAANSSEKGG